MSTVECLICGKLSTVDFVNKGCKHCGVTFSEEHIRNEFCKNARVFLVFWMIIFLSAISVTILR